MKKALFIIIFLFLYSYVYALPANLSPILIPKDTDDIFFVEHYSYQSFTEIRIIWECTGKKFNTLGEVLSFLKKRYIVIVIFKDPIDNDYFVCVKNKK